MNLDQFNQGRRPAERLLRRGTHECYALIHFGLNTYTNREWGYGDEDPALFNPVDFDADAIVRACRDGGLTGLILVCKHHDGFCLWPTASTTHNITRSPWRDGKGDLVREFSDACRRHGLDMGFYVSPWDRNHPEYGKPGYIEVFRQQLREIYTNYGPAFEAWFDGANGGDGYYGGAREVRNIDRTTYYDWDNTMRIIRELQPNAAIFSDIGPDLRWVGNENGFAAPESFGSYTPHAPEPGAAPTPGFAVTPEGEAGHADGRYYMPPECDVPLRPGWFYHESQDNQLRSLPLLMQIYMHSVGCGGFLSFGLAPDRRGLLHPNDIARLREFKQAVDALFDRPVCALQNVRCEAGEAVVFFGKTVQVNLIELAEAMEQGEKITRYEVALRGRDGEYRTVVTGSAIGRKRLKPLAAPVECNAIRVRILESAAPVLSLRLGAYLADLAPQEAAATLAPDPRLRADYAKLPPQTGAVWSIDLGTATTVKGFIYTPDPALPPGTPDRYEFDVSDDGENWRRAAAGEFSNLRANPLPQAVEFEPAETVRYCRFRATRMLVPGAEIAGQEFGILRK